MKTVSFRINEDELEKLMKIGEQYKDELKFHPSITDLVLIAIRTFIEEKRK